MTDEEETSLKLGGIELTSRQRWLFDTYTSHELKELPENDVFEVSFTVGSQRFFIARYCENVEVAEWFRGMLAVALDQIVDAGWRQTMEEATRLGTKVVNGGS